MSSDTDDFSSYFSSLRLHAAKHHCRFGVVLQGIDSWNRMVCQSWLNAIEGESVFQLGGKAYAGVRFAAFNKGQQLLGQECSLLLCDMEDGWDANSFSAALGTLVGGGILVILDSGKKSQTPAELWLQRSLSELICLSENSEPLLPRIDSEANTIDFSQQQLAVSNIVRVVEGHRKRPLILTADRGRGKSSALGMAAAKLMTSRSLNIIVTAPTIASVAPVFQFAEKHLQLVSQKPGTLEISQSSLQFMAPDEILRQRPDCDLLLIDEAAALPLPTLQSFVEHYHRTVFSSTINGYEGSGRGFTLKFQTWLKSVRPDMRTQKMDQPIRWTPGDPLEAWQRRSFLLDFDFESVSALVDVNELDFHSIDKSLLLENPSLLHRIFSLLVNAHYQTSPNDLFHLLGDESMGVFIATHGDTVVGCILSVREGELSSSLIEDIQLGKRRPRGHLTPVTIANQIGIPLAATQSSVRIMRIAVHPDLQNLRIGSELIKRFSDTQKVDYLSTSFGVTTSLVGFWRKCGFQTIKIGSQRDQASGCYSMLMVFGQKLSWLKSAVTQHDQHFIFELSDSLQRMEPKLVKALLAKEKTTPNDLPISLLRQYAKGGANYESIAIWLHKLLVSLPAVQVIRLSDVMVAKVLQRKTWQECAHEYRIAGRKQIETTLRQELVQILDDLQCKYDE